MEASAVTGSNPPRWRTKKFRPIHFCPSERFTFTSRILVEADFLGDKVLLLELELLFKKASECSNSLH